MLVSCLSALAQILRLKIYLVVGFESDTCNIMVGRHNSVLSLVVKEKQSV